MPGRVAARAQPGHPAHPSSRLRVSRSPSGRFRGWRRAAAAPSVPGAPTATTRKDLGHHVADLHRRVRRQRRISCRRAAGRRARKRLRTPTSSRRTCIRAWPRSVCAGACSTRRSSRTSTTRAEPSSRVWTSTVSLGACSWPVRRRRRCTTSRRRSRRRSSSSARRTTATSAASRRAPWRRTCCTEPRAPCSSPRPTTRPRPIRTIAVAYDDGIQAKAALEYAAQLARRLDAHLEIIAGAEHELYAGPAMIAAADLEELMRDDVAERVKAEADAITDVPVDTRVVTGPMPECARRCRGGRRPPGDRLTRIRAAPQRPRRRRLALPRRQRPVPRPRRPAGRRGRRGPRAEPSTSAPQPA